MIIARIGKKKRGRLKPLSISGEESANHIIKTPVCAPFTPYTAQY